MSSCVRDAPCVPESGAVSPGEIWKATGRARAAAGHPRWRQLAEMALLHLGDGRLTPEEYFGYRLFRRDLPFAEKRKYLGYWRWDAVYAANHPRCAAVANSKLLTYELLARAGLPHPRLRAVINGKSSYPECARLTTAAGVADLLRSGPLPLFIKPDSGSHGLGARLVDRVEGDVLQLRDGRRLAVEAFAAELVAPGSAPLLVQDVIVAHPTLAGMTGGTPPTARVYVMMLDGEALVHRAVLRVPVGDAVVDNFHAGRTGNLVAEIDPGSGACGGGVGGIGFDYKLHDRHPGTGAPLRGVEIPGWREALDLLRQAVRHFPGLHIQAWDVAFTPAGPTLIEVNAKGEFRILQHSAQRGLIDDDFRRAGRL